MALGLVPWTVWLAVTLPHRHLTRHYDLTWVGFDVALVAALGALMWLAQRRSTLVEVAATVAGTLLIVDAWFDITGASPGADLAQAVASAVVFELPIAAVCLWLTRHAEVLRRRQAASLVHRRRRTSVQVR
ncbi:hypothetical protein acdb102_00780 [Acidothermaceae bacterium B102]|nr:hypothetical protein acdb102_00780 [Acidothermaceae bacterium B102]